MIVQDTSGIETLDHYLDDFIFAGSEFNNNCKILMDTFMNISSKLGVPIAENKTVWTTTFLTFLGLDIDTLLMVVKIPADKLCKLKQYQVGSELANARMRKNGQTTDMS
jgi:hypothetical protein